MANYAFQLNNTTGGRSYWSSKLGRDVRASKLAALAKNL